MASSDGTLLCVFSGSDCIIVDDFDRKVQGTIPITTIWPQLANYGMGTDLDAVCRDDHTGQFIFFKGRNCTVNNFQKKQWANGDFAKFFYVQSSNGGDDFDPKRFCGSFQNRQKEPNSLRLHGYVGGQLQYLNGESVDLTAPQFKAITLGGPTPISQEGDWAQMGVPHAAHLPLPYREVACSYVFRPSQLPGGTDELTPAMLVADAHPGADTAGPGKSSNYKCTFIKTSDFVPLTTMWAGWEDGWKVDAATRVDASMLQGVIPDPDHHHHHHPHQGPGPVVNPLCDQLPNIMKSVCSLTLLLHKAIDACYPESSWPKQPYPDGCSSWGGHKHRHCGSGCGCTGHNSQDPRHKTDRPGNNS